MHRSKQREPDKKRLAARQQLTIIFFRECSGLSAIRRHVWVLFFLIVPPQKLKEKGRVRTPLRGAGTSLPTHKATPVRAPAFAGAQHSASACAWSLTLRSEV